ncbi:MAG: pirin family protein, partial [Asticcacaulis sp.]|nr:pirin family protein [Asticcacaulis sp.]
MSVTKPVLRLHSADRDDIGDLITRRPVPNRGLDHIGAFLFLNHHGPQVYAPNNR